MNCTEQNIQAAINPGFTSWQSDGIYLPEIKGQVMIVVRTDQVHLNEVMELRKFLTVSEVEKSQRFRFNKDRVSYIVVHGLLRMMLGRHLGISPQEVSMVYNSYGKPAVSGCSRNVCFNMTSRAGVSVLAFDSENEIGVDVERLDEAFEFESIVKRFFPAKEIQYIFQSKVNSRQRFYQIWTRKEAYLKAIGTGITENLKTEVLNEIMNETRSIGNESRPGIFTFRSILFEQDFRITLAIKAGSEPIQAYYLRNFRTDLLKKNEA